MKVLFLLLLTALVEAADKKGSYVTQNVDLLNKTDSQKWLIEGLKAKSRMMCLGRCNLNINCTSVIFSIDQTSPSDCFLFSKVFSNNELVPSNSSEMYFKSLIGNKHYWVILIRSIKFLNFFSGFSVPAGIQNNVTLSSFTNLGYTSVYQVTYGTTTTTADINNVRSGCTATSSLCVACYLGSNPSNLLTVACGNCYTLTSQTGYNSAQYVNGAYFYFLSSYSFGFAENSTITQNQADVNNNGSSTRISWHLDRGCGGWRCGSTLWLNSDASYYKLLLRN